MRVSELERVGVGVYCEAPGKGLCIMAAALDTKLPRWHARDTPAHTRPRRGRRTRRLGNWVWRKVFSRGGGSLSRIRVAEEGCVLAMAR